MDQEMNNEVEQNLENNNDEQQPTDNLEANNSEQGVQGTDNSASQAPILEEWQKDSRYGKRWHKPDDVYKSFRNLEPQFTDVSSKLAAINKVLKENGFGAETLADELKKYADYRDPQSRINQVYNYVNGFLNNDVYSSRIVNFFSQLEQEELQRLYPNMSAEQINKQQELEAKLKQLETVEQQRQHDKYMADTTSQITNGLTDCENLAKEYGFKMSNEVKNYLLTYCRDNDIDPRYIKNVFQEIYRKQLLEARDQKIIANYTARKQKIKDAQIISGGGSKVGNFAPNGDAKSKLKATFERILGK